MQDHSCDGIIEKLYSEKKKCAFIREKGVYKQLNFTKEEAKIILDALKLRGCDYSKFLKNKKSMTKARLTRIINRKMLVDSLIERIESKYEKE